MALVDRSNVSGYAVALEAILVAAIAGMPDAERNSIRVAALKYVDAIAEQIAAHAPANQKPVAEKIRSAALSMVDGILQEPTPAK